MSEAEIRHMHNDIELIKEDIAVIKHLLSEEGELTEEAQKRLAKARNTSEKDYLEL
jgi:hypothetical protein